MKLLSFLAKRFWWRAHSKTLEGVADQEVEDGIEEAVVVFVHAEVSDTDPEADRRVFKHTLKHIKWLAGKRDFQRVALHSFTHLGAESAPPAYAQGFLDRLQERLEQTGYEVKQTPFGTFSEWDLSVYGESLAKVWKEI
ncbi:MAG: hypothetical protein O2816_13245 [Planctomycetota bacterium]|nr:hypothetical protein [Planctomycetota bacterium]